jgi:hypothetical protein
MRRHRTDLLSLLFGLLFLAVVGTWAGSSYLHWDVDWELPNLGWFVAGGLILVGLLGLLGSMRRNPAPPPSFDATPVPTPDVTDGSTPTQDLTVGPAASPVGRDAPAATTGPGDEPND